MGPVSAPEKRVALVFLGVAAAWIFHPLFGEWVRITDTGIAIAGAVALFLIPADWKSRTFLLDWGDGTEGALGHSRSFRRRIESGAGD
jgi:sodium-dependent dicarboxylate transporter 2/3/5